MGLLFKVRPKRCDSQCLVQTSQETRDSKERKNAKETRIIHSRDKLDQIIPHLKKEIQAFLMLSQAKVALGCPTAKTDFELQVSLNSRFGTLNFDFRVREGYDRQLEYSFDGYRQ